MGSPNQLYDNLNGSHLRQASRQVEQAYRELSPDAIVAVCNSDESIERTGLILAPDIVKLPDSDNFADQYTFLKSAGSTKDLVAIILNQAKLPEQSAEAVMAYVHARIIEAAVIITNSAQTNPDGVWELG